MTKVKAGKTSRSNTAKLDSWIEKALQTVCYWMGYENMLFPTKVLPELALGTEFSKLLKNFAPKDVRILRECPYSKDKKQRVDIAIVDAGKVELAKKGNLSECKYAIELKCHASLKQIAKDVKKLGDIKRKNPDMKTYSVMFTDKYSKDFLNDNGEANRNLPEKYSHLRVARVCKVTESFRKRMKAYFAILVEIK